MESKKLLMVHIPKCAGITMNQIIGLDNPKFFGNHYGHHYANFIKNKMKDKYKNYISFCIIRNPWDRLWSSYNFMKSGSEFKGPKKSVRENNNNLNSFEDYIYDIYDTKKYLNVNSKINGTDLYHHKQSNWITNKSNDTIVDIIGKFEDLSSLVKTIEHDFNMDGLGQRFKSTHSNKTKKVNYREVYNRSMINKVSEMYQDDIKLGDYEF
jgi:hypothetical protein